MYRPGWATSNCRNSVLIRSTRHGSYSGHERPSSPARSMCWKNGVVSTHHLGPGGPHGGGGLVELVQEVGVVLDGAEAARTSPSTMRSRTSHAPTRITTTLGLNAWRSRTHRPRQSQPGSIGSTSPPSITAPCGQQPAAELAAVPHREAVGRAGLVEPEAERARHRVAHQEHLRRGGGRGLCPGGGGRGTRRVRRRRHGHRLLVVRARQGAQGLVGDRLGPTGGGGEDRDHEGDRRHRDDESSAWAGGGASRGSAAR